MPTRKERERATHGGEGKTQGYRAQRDTNESHPRSPPSTASMVYLSLTRGACGKAKKRIITASRQLFPPFVLATPSLNGLEHRNPKIHTALSIRVIYGGSQICSHIDLPRGAVSSFALLTIDPRIPFYTLFLDHGYCSWIHHSPSNRADACRDSNKCR